ncbi:tetratricopeptide repeat protein [Candidatus Laterigemmans baculatus]|uniref:tetratricopeptide repeat protein n=1 Tax=Candidatus Laterigemmans baculatus TaxID=2770505 RepID=UPI0013D95F09|nr:tetratricopeptide repeat protein [Candidatus Laterigemmans baculatus]
MPTKPLTESATAVRLNDSATAAPANLSPSLRRAVQLAESGQYHAALQLLRPQGRSPETLNAIGVCLMRMGNLQEAVPLYHAMVMKPGCTWMRPEVPTLYKINFATALLLKGSPAGCLAILKEINAPRDPRIQQLRGALRKWEASLSFWRRWDWYLSHVEPPKCRVELDFVPGHFFHAPEPVDLRSVEEKLS